MRVLYVNHTGQVSGAERSLLDLIEAARDHVDAFVACPDGELRRRAAERGIPTFEIEPLRLGFGASAVDLAAAPVRLLRTGMRVRGLARRHDVDVVHAASTRAGLILACSRPLGRARVVDVRDALPSGLMGALVRWLLRLSADLLVFNSRFTRDEFGPSAPAAAAVIYPPVPIGGLLGSTLSGATDDHAPVIGVVGQITPWKGQDDAIRILAVVREHVPDARLRIVGSVVFGGREVSFDNESFRRRLTELASELGVDEAVELAEPSDDLEAVFASLDVLLVPSWAEPFGRVVAEAMAAGVPVVATRRGGPAELIEHGSTGYLVEPRRPDLWVKPVVRLLTDPTLRHRIADTARSRIGAILGGDAGARAVDLYGQLARRRGDPARVTTRKARQA